VIARAAIRQFTNSQIHQFTNSPIHQFAKADSQPGSRQPAPEFRDGARPCCRLAGPDRTKDQAERRDFRLISDDVQNRRGGLRVARSMRHTPKIHLPLRLHGAITGARGSGAKEAMPGQDPGGILITMLLGVGGALLGGFLWRALGLYSAGEAAGFLMSIAGAVVILFVYRRFRTLKT
jgi:uncharacterized membrane protein YeaQ/YmgE (transglycosylase-associated protein family)